MCVGLWCVMLKWKERITHRIPTEISQSGRVWIVRGNLFIPLHREVWDRPLGLLCHKWNMRGVAYVVFFHDPSQSHLHVIISLAFGV